MGFLGKLFGGGSSASTDRKTTLTGYGDLNNVFNFGMDSSKSLSNTGQQTTAAGLSTMQDPINYYKSLLSGNRTAVAGAVAPSSNAIAAGADAARNQSATLGTARGGGNADASRAISDQSREQVDNLIMGVQPGAAGELEKAGATEASIGNQQVNEALGFGDLSEKGAADMTKEATDSRMDSYKINQQTTQQVMSVVGNILAGFGF